MCMDQDKTLTVPSGVITNFLNKIDINKKLIMVEDNKQEILFMFQIL